MASTSASSSLDTRRTTSLLSTPPSLLSQFSSPLPTRSYSRQYAALYDFRLRKLRRGRLLQKAKERWEGGGSAAAGGVAKGKEEKKTAAGIKHTARILDVKKGQVTYVSGIVYVEMRLKPDVLADLSREAYLPPLPPVTSYSDPTTDSIYLEDESGRLKLVGPLLTGPAQRGLFVTGTVGAFLGTERENGEFHVQDVCWPGLPLRSEKTGGLSKGVKMEEDEGEEEREDDEYVVLTSGLDLGGGDGEMGFAAAEMRLSLLAEWVGGEIGDEEHRRKSSRIAGVVIAGNLMTTAQSTSSLSSSATDSTTPSTDAPVASTSKSSSSSSSSAKLSKQASSQANANLTPSPAEVLLAHLVPLSASLPVVLMPGATDPASAALPQQAVHRAVLRGAGKWAGSSSKGSGEGSSGSSSKTNGDAKAAQKRSAPGDAEDDDAEGEQAAGGVHLYNNPSWIQFGSGSAASSSSTSSSTSSNRQNRTRILASSGQNLDDVLKYLPSASKAKAAAAVAASASQEVEASGSGSKKGEDVEMGDGEEGEEDEEDERLRAACRLLEYGHIAPTAPDTLWCFPFTDRDPFLLSSPAQIPDVFLIGNQPHFATTLWRQEDERSEPRTSAEGQGKAVGVQVVLVPSFAKTGEVGLLNLRTRGVRRGRVGWEM